MVVKTKCNHQPEQKVRRGHLDLFKLYSENTIIVPSSLSSLGQRPWLYKISWCSLLLRVSQGPFASQAS
jgi:hypothetical protein